MVGLAASLGGPLARAANGGWWGNFARTGGLAYWQRFPSSPSFPPVASSESRA